MILCLAGKNLRKIKIYKNERIKYIKFKYGRFI